MSKNSLSKKTFANVFKMLFTCCVPCYNKMALKEGDVSIRDECYVDVQHHKPKAISQQHMQDNTKYFPEKKNDFLKTKFIGKSFNFTSQLEENYY